VADIAPESICNKCIKCDVCNQKDTYNQVVENVKVPMKLTENTNTSKVIRTVDQADLMRKYGIKVIVACDRFVQLDWVDWVEYQKAKQSKEE